LDVISAHDTVENDMLRLAGRDDPAHTLDDEIAVRQNGRDENGRACGQRLAVVHLPTAIEVVSATEACRRQRALVRTQTTD
jgi:hypothetical protein